MDSLWLYLLLGFPVIFAIGAKLIKSDLINWTEMALQIILCVVVISGFWFAFRYADAWDTELWNGSVTSVNAEQRNCRQSWSTSRDSFCTNQQSKQVRDYPDGETCTTDSKGKRKCTKYARYHTEYRSIFPWQIPIPTWLLILTGLVSVGGSLGLFVLFLKYDVDIFGGSGVLNRRRYN